jgi:hypothetical protein
MRRLDKDGDGSVSFDEFERWWEKQDTCASLLMRRARRVPATAPQSACARARGGLSIRGRWLTQPRCVRRARHPHAGATRTRFWRRQAQSPSPSPSPSRSSWAGRWSWW